MKNNAELQKDVQDAIKWEPLLHAAEIGVMAKDGVITLTGTVDSFAKKRQAQSAAKNVGGVKAVAEDIEINYGTSFTKNDTEIAHEVVNTFKWNWEIPNDRIKVEVENGWVTLGGELDWNFQRLAAGRAAENLMGVKGISNNISIKSETQEEIEQSDVENALGRSWSIDDNNIKVGVAGNKVTLTGTVESLYQKDEAARLAWNAPGVWAVENELCVVYK